MHEKYIDINEASAQTGIPKRTLLKFVKIQGLPHLKLSKARNGKIRFQKSDLEAYLKKHTYG